LLCLSLGYSKSIRLFDYTAIDPDILVGLSFSVLCLALTYRPFPAARYPLIARSSRFLSEMSYSLYVSHFPLVILIATIAYGSAKLSPTGAALIQFTGWSGVLVGFGFAVYLLFESRTPFIRSALRTWTNTQRGLKP
jgi:peptidoglycan/LPS O-acetylase OafA/YrhL